MRSTLSRSSSLATLPLPFLLAGLTACAVDPSEVDRESDPRAQTASLDAGAPLDGSAPAQRDASADAGSDPCGAGKVTCGSTCIDAIAATAEAVQERVLGRSCGLSRSCHGGPSPQASLHLDTLDALFGGVVGQPATEDPSLQLIAPGKPEESYLVRKLRNTHGKVGTVMPPGAPLCEPKIAAVEAWIRAGAMK